MTNLYQFIFSPPIQSYQYAGSNNKGNESQMFKDTTPSETMEQDIGYQFSTGIIPPNQQKRRQREVSKIVPAATVTYAHVSPPPTRYSWQGQKIGNKLRMLPILAYFYSGFT